MGVYLVRHIETKEVQGIFWGSLDEVWDTFDEIGDPLRFEYAPLKPGALYDEDSTIGEGQIAQQFTDVASEDDLKEFNWGKFSASEMFACALHNQAALHWKAFDDAMTGHGVIARIRQRRA